MKVFTIDLTLNLLLPQAILTYVATRNSESTNSSIMIMFHTNTLVCDSLAQIFRSLASLMTSDGSIFYNTGS